MAQRDEEGDERSENGGVQQAETKKIFLTGMEGIKGMGRGGNLSARLCVCLPGRSFGSVTAARDLHSLGFPSSLFNASTV